MPEKSQSGGLYGSSTGANMVRAAGAELIGTFILVFTGTAVAASATLGSTIAGSPFDSLAVAVAFGFALIVVVACIGHVSGAHVNPAVTISLFAIGKFPGRFVPIYCGAQLCGAALGAAATWITAGKDAYERANLGATALADGVSPLRGFATEALITAVLVFVVVSVATDSRVPKAIPPLAVGLALCLGVLIGGAATGGGVNPARALGPMIVSLSFDNVWIFIIAPIAGGVLAAAIYDKFLAEGKNPSDDDDTDGGPEAKRPPETNQKSRRRGDPARSQSTEGGQRPRRPRPPEGSDQQPQRPRPQRPQP